MTRPTRLNIDETALLHNLAKIKSCAPDSKVIAMVKANAYGCGIASVVPVLEGRIYAFGVACLEEAIAIRALGIRSECILFQGIFTPDELDWVVKYQLQIVLHQPHHLQWLLATPLANKIKVWVKIDTGMHRLGFAPQESHTIINALMNCPWVEQEIGLLTHLASADEPSNALNESQLAHFNALNLSAGQYLKSVANSAAILALPETRIDVVRSGIMLYGVSPFVAQTAQELGLVPVMRFVSAISAIQHYPSHSPIGYGGIWETARPSVIGVIPAGYGDGYPRHIQQGTPVWINGQYAPIVGRVSMDMLTVDLTDCQDVRIGEPVELWGQHIPVEKVALSAGTIAYELLAQISPRVRQD